MITKIIHNALMSKLNRGGLWFITDDMQSIQKTMLKKTFLKVLQIYMYEYIRSLMPKILFKKFKLKKGLEKINPSGKNINQSCDENINNDPSEQ